VASSSKKRSEWRCIFCKFSIFSHRFRPIHLDKIVGQRSRFFFGRMSLRQPFAAASIPSIVLVVLLCASSYPILIISVFRLFSLLRIDWRVWRLFFKNSSCGFCDRKAYFRPAASRILLFIYLVLFGSSSAAPGHTYVWGRNLMYAARFGAQKHENHGVKINKTRETPDHRRGFFFLVTGAISEMESQTFQSCQLP
jgi:hypothetical protein